MKRRAARTIQQKYDALMPMGAAARFDAQISMEMLDFYIKKHRKAAREAVRNIGKPVITIDRDDREGA